METPSEIRNAISAFENDTNFRMLRSRWEQDFNLYRMKQYDAGKGFYSYTSNAPRILADKLISMIVESTLTIRVPDDVLVTDEERAIADNIERFLYGCFNLNDARLTRMVDTPTLRGVMAWMSVIRGGFAVRPIVRKDTDGETVPDIAVWDLYNTSYGVGGKGLVWAAHKRPATRASILDEYGVEIAGDETTVIDFFDSEFSRIVVEEQEVYQYKHNLGYVPVFIRRVGETPILSQENYQQTGVHIGESVFASDRGLYPILNKTISDLLTIIRRGVKTPLAVYSTDGTRTLESDIYQVEKAAVIPMRVGEDIRPVLMPTMPADAASFLNFIMGDIQRGGLSHVALGELGFRLSGFAISQLQDTLSTVVSPFIRTIETAYTLVCQELLQQYSAGGFKPIKVRGRNSRNQPFGMPQADVIKPTDVKGDWHPEIKLVPVLPKDDLERYQIAIMAAQGEVPLLSMKTRREIVGVEDTKQEESRVAREWAENLPVIKLYRALEEAEAANRPDIAMNIVAELRRLMGGAQMSSGGSPPTGRVGMPSSVMPAEAAGGEPPGAKNATMPVTGQEG